MRMAKLFLCAVLFILCLQTVITSGKKKGGLKKRLRIVEDRQKDLSTTHREAISQVKSSVDELKTYIDCSIKAMKEEILETLRGSVKPPRETNTLATTEAPDQTTITTTTSPLQLPSCLELHQNGERRSGVYTIYPLPSNPPVQVYCDMDTAGGGWTVFQRRQDGSEDFYRTWADYASGFGNVSGEFWLGNDLISLLTSRGPHELRIDIGDYDGNSAFATYSKFRVAPSDNNYTLDVDGYSGDAGDEMSRYSAFGFVTRDRDNNNNCARGYPGGWWYRHWCGFSTLNGLYGQRSGAGGVVWWHWKNSAAPLKWTEMKLRAKSHA